MGTDMRSDERFALGMMLCGLFMVLLAALCSGCGAAVEPEKCPEPVIAKDCAILDEQDQLVFVDCADLPRE